MIGRRIWQGRTRSSFRRLLYPYVSESRSPSPAPVSSASFDSASFHCANNNIDMLNIVGSHNIGVVMATPQGLVVPNIKDVQNLSILEITRELSRLQNLARDNKLCPGDVYGGTITLISNIGAIGGKFGVPLLNLPEVAIVALGRIQKVPQFGDDGNLYPISIMSVSDAVFRVRRTQVFEVSSLIVLD